MPQSLLKTAKIEYIKSGEYFRDYSFRLDDGRRVHFKLVSADTEQNNNKSDDDNERRFILADKAPVCQDSGDLVVRFEYRPDPDNRKQTVVNDAAVPCILADAACDEWRTALEKKEPTEKNPDRTLIVRCLADYTARNSFDYFIHKDLGRFLHRELDFYIKTEVMRLDDIDHADASAVEQYLGEVRAMRAVGHKVIAMLAQLEDFQKRLWLKKKFVIETNYCVTLDHVPDELYARIIANDTQREEWVRLFAIDQVAASLVTPSYSVPLTIDFLKANPTLVLDTRFFDQEFTIQLLTQFDNLDEQIDGVLIHSENFQALNLSLLQHRGRIKCIYIDPPYNTGDDGFPYKDNYLHSSWLSMMKDRLRLAYEVLSEDGLLFVSVDDHELHHLLELLDAIWGPNHIATLARRTKTGGGSAAAHFAVEHDYVVAWAKDKDAVEPLFIPYQEEYLRRYSEEDEDGRYYWDTMERSSTATKPYKIPAPDGTWLEGKWFRSESKYYEDKEKGEVRIIPTASGGWSVQFKQRLPQGRKMRSLIDDDDLRKNEFKSNTV